MPLGAAFLCRFGLDSRLLCATALLGALSSLQVRGHTKYCNIQHFLKVLLTSSSKQGCAIHAESEAHRAWEKTVVEVEKLLKFCSLKWDDKCLNHQKNKRVIKTISFNQARKPIYKTSLKSFKGYENHLSVLEKLN